MQTFRKIWLWLKNIFQRWFRQGNKSKQSEIIAEKVDYENLFMQLLDGVQQGWSRGKIAGFLLGSDINETQLLIWLHSFGEKLQTSTSNHRELAMRMIALGNIDCGKISPVSFAIGKELLKQEAERYLTQANQLYNVGNLSEAIAYFDKVIELEPNHLEALVNKGIALDELGESAASLVCFEEVISLKSDYQPAWYNKGLCLGGLGKLAEAIACFDHALELQPYDYIVWYNKGVALENLQDLEAALICFDKTLELKPDSYQTWCDRSTILSKLGRLEEAIFGYDKALEIKPDNEIIWFNKGLALEKLDKKEAAISCYDQAIALKSDYSEALAQRYQLTKTSEVLKTSEV